MIVFKFFTEKMKLFADHIACKAAAEMIDVSTPHWLNSISPHLHVSSILMYM